MTLGGFGLKVRCSASQTESRHFLLLLLWQRKADRGGGQRMGALYNEN
jgi:hypothetical protein